MISELLTLENMRSVASGILSDKPSKLHYMLDLPDDIKIILSDTGALIISIHTEDKWTFQLHKNRFQVYNIKLNISDAGDYCVQQGGHLASVESQQEQDEINQVLEGNSDTTFWLGGLKKTGGERWQWTDGRQWVYQNWNKNRERGTGNCLMLWLSQHWYQDECNGAHPFVCRANLETMSGNQTFILRKEALPSPTLHFWWNNTIGSTGFKLIWQVENV